MTLFAFGSAGEREAFRQLTSVQGVGGRVALAILSTLDPAELATAIAHGDKAMVARANGVGPKLAQRIVNELAGKMGSPALAATARQPPPRAAAPRRTRSARSPTSASNPPKPAPPSPPRPPTSATARRWTRWCDWR